MDPRGAAASLGGWGPRSAADDPVNSPAGLNSVIRSGLLTSDVWYTGCKEVNFQNFILMPSDAMRGHILHRAQMAAEELPPEAPQSDWRSCVPPRAAAAGTDPGSITCPPALALQTRGSGGLGRGARGTQTPGRPQRTRARPPHRTAPHARVPVPNLRASN